MTSSKPWFIAQRGESLAYMYLSRSPKLQINRQSAPVGLDFLASIPDIPCSLFGIHVRSSTQMSKLVNAKGRMLSSYARPLNELARNATFPVAILAIDVTTEEIRFGWVKSPVPNLASQPTDVFETCPATTEVLTAAVEAVESWYTQPRTR